MPIVESSLNQQQSHQNSLIQLTDKIRVLIFWTPGSDHHNDLNKILTKQCEIFIQTNDDIGRRKNIIYLKQIKRSKSNCLTTYYYRYHNYNDGYIVEIKFYLICWPDSYEPKSDFFQYQFARKYFPLSNLAVGFFSNQDSFQYVQSWLKAFHDFYQQHQQISYRSITQLYLVQLDNSNAIKSIDQINDFIKQYHVRFIGNRITKNNGSSIHSSIFSRKNKTLNSSSCFNYLESLFRWIIKVNIDGSNQLSVSLHNYHQSSSKEDLRDRQRNQYTRFLHFLPFSWHFIDNNGSFMKIMSRYFKTKFKLWWHQMFYNH